MAPGIGGGVVVRGVIWGGLEVSWGGVEGSEPPTGADEDEWANKTWLNCFCNEGGLNAVSWYRVEGG